MKITVERLRLVYCYGSKTVIEDGFIGLGTSLQCHCYEGINRKQGNDSRLSGPSAYPVKSVMPPLNQLTVNIFTVSDFDDFDSQNSIENGVNDTVILDSDSVCVF